MLFIILVIVIGAVVMSGGEDNVQELLDAGDRYLSEMEYERALAEYRAVIGIDPKNADAYMGIVEVYIRTNDFEQALIEAQTGYDVLPSVYI